MSVEKSRSERQHNLHSLSHKCPIGNGGTDEYEELYTPKRYRCNGFRGVCMIMGVLVYVVESENGTVSFQQIMPKKIPQEQKKELMDFGFSKNNFSLKSQVPRQILFRNKK